MDPAANRGARAVDPILALSVAAAAGYAEDLLPGGYASGSAFKEPQLWDSLARFSRQVDPAVFDSRMNSALLAAVAAGALPRSTWLLDRGADPDAAHSRGTALSTAAEKGHEEIAFLLLQRGASATKTVPPYDVTYTMLQAVCKNRQADLLAALLNHGADPNHPGHDGEIPLHAAVEGGDEDVINLLLDRGADIHASGKYSGTALFTACETNSEEVATLLLQRGASPNDPKGSKRICLHEVCATNRLPLLKLLLAAGVDVEATDGSATALTRAAEHGYTDVVDLLLQHGATVPSDALYVACRNGYEETVERLVQAGADVNERDDDDSILHTACRFNRAAVAAKLLASGADPNTIFPGGVPALLYCVQQRYVGIVKSLLQHGARVNSRMPGTPGSTSLHVAAELGQSDLARLLLEHGADIRAKDDKGRTAARAARAKAEAKAQVKPWPERNGHLLEVARLLEEEEAKGKQGQTGPGAGSGAGAGAGPGTAGGSAGGK